MWNRSIARRRWEVCIKQGTIQARPTSHKSSFFPGFLEWPSHRSALTFFIACALKVRSKILMLPSSYRSLQAVAVMAVLLFAAGCGEDPRFSARTQYLGGTYGGAPAAPPQDNVSYWDGDNVTGKPSITISLREQRAYFYKSGVLVGVSQLSTGQEGLNTPSGRFSIIQKDKNHFSSLFGDYVDSAGNVVVPNVDVTKDPKPKGAHFRGTPMPYFMRIVSGTGLHAGYLPGHGCIRMPEFMAENFFKSVSLGTPVTITH
jgi:L,D-transpeptidase catalytic domain